MPIGRDLGFFLDVVPLTDRISSFILTHVSYCQVRWLILIFAGFCQSCFAGFKWQRQPESLTHNCEFCEAGRSALKALAVFHPKDPLRI